MSINKATGIYCPWCRQMNDPYSMLYRDTGGMTGQGMRAKCGRGHSGEMTQIMNMKPDKQQLALNEKQPPGSVIQTVWVEPQAIMALQQRFPQTMMTNLYSLINAIADGDSILVEGEHVREMRALQDTESRPIQKGRDVVGLARENATLRAAVNELQEKLRNAGTQQQAAVASLPAGAMDLLQKMAAQLGMDASALTTQQVAIPASAPAPVVPASSGFDYEETMDNMGVDPFEASYAPVSPAHDPGSMRGIPVPSPGKPLR